MSVAAHPARPAAPPAAAAVPAGAAPRGPGLVGLTLLLAVSLLATARLGLLLAVQPSAVTPLWPPSGLALAALMLFGRRALPGCALGLLAGEALSAGALGGAVASILATVALASASLAEVALAAWLLRRVPGAMREHPVRETLRYAAVCAGCCALAALAGPLVRQLAAGADLARATAADSPFGILTWWVGDTTGMLVVAPLLLVASHPLLRVDRVAVQAFPTLCLGFGLTLFTTFATGMVGREARMQRFEAEATRLAVSLANQAEMAARDLETLQHVLSRVPFNRDEFQALASPMLARSPWQSTFSWLPRVTAAQREAFETSADGLDGASVRQLADDGTLVRAGARPELFPIAWTVPQAGREALVGVDQAADRWRGPALAAARANGHVGVTVPMHSLANATDERLVQVMFAPVPPLHAAQARADAPASPRGFVSATIDLDRLLRAALLQRDVRGQQVLLFDPRSPDAAALEWLSATQVRMLDPAARRQADADWQQGLFRRVDVRVADRGWVLVCRPVDAGLLPAFGWAQGAVFGSGLAFTALLTGFLIARRRRDEALRQARDRLEDQVAERTRDLGQTNERLRAEVEDHRRTERLLEEASRRAEGASRAKSLFLANMSHEIRTPLNAVLGYTQLLLEDRRQPADARERLQVVHSAGYRLLGLINDVLDLAKIEAGGLQLSEGPIHLARELADVAALFAPRAREKGLDLRLDLQLDGVPLLRGDRTKLGQVVLNLLGNALKFTDEGAITLRARREAGITQIEVEDTGPGMSAAEVATLFTAFRQGSAGREKGGTGLGLALSRSIAQAMGGDLLLASTPGMGTQVQLTLPLPVDAGAPGAGEGEGAGDAGLMDAPGAAGKRRRVDPATPCRALVVEDDAHSRDVLATLLAQAGCTVTTAVDGQAGLEACEAAEMGGAGTAWLQAVQQGAAPGPQPTGDAHAAPFDIVFSDIRMPRLDGLAMMRALRARLRTATMPLVAVSASSLEHQRRDYIDQGFDDFIGKPYPFEAIYDALAQHAHVRFVAVPDEDDPTADPRPADGGDAAAGAAAAATSPLVRDAAWQARLQALADAAAQASATAVRRGLAALHPADLDAAQRRAVEAELRRYDFDALERLVRACIDTVTP